MWPCWSPSLALTSDWRCARMYPCQALSTLLLHQLQLGELVSYHGNTLYDPAAWSTYCHYSRADLPMPVAPADLPEVRPRPSAASKWPSSEGPGRRHLNRLSPGHTLTSLIQGLGVVRFPGLKRDIRSIGLQKAAEWRFAMIIGNAGAWPITIGPDDGTGLRYQRRKTASACAGWAAKWRIMLAMDCRG